MLFDNLKFIKTAKHKKFEYKPRYWNEEKEDLDRRVREAEGEAKDDYHREAIRERISFRNGRQTQNKASFMSTLRVLFIVLILSLTLYFIYRYL